MDEEKLTRKGSRKGSKQEGKQPKPSRQDTLNIMNSKEIISMLHDGGKKK